MNELLFCLTLLGIGSLIFRLIKVSHAKNSKHTSSNIDSDAQIEVGYPTSNSRTLHMISTLEPPIPNHYFTDEELGRVKEEDDDRSDKSIYTVNMYVESHYELNLSLFEKELTIQMVNDAYEKLLNKHVYNIQIGIPETFNIKAKKEARDYLINKLNKEKGH